MSQATPQAAHGGPGSLEDENTRTHIVAAYCADSGLQALAAECGVSANAIRQVLVAEGVPIRKRGQRCGQGRPIVPQYEIDSYEDAVTEGRHPTLPWCYHAGEGHRPTDPIITGARYSYPCEEPSGCATAAMRG
jgi:hypothetical protein